jgi:hypothetical protein
MAINFLAMELTIKEKWHYMYGERRHQCCLLESEAKCFLLPTCTTPQYHILCGWCSGNTLDLYSGGAQLESELGHQRSWLCFVPQGKFHDNISIRPGLLSSKSFITHHSPNKHLITVWDQNLCAVKDITRTWVLLIWVVCWHTASILLRKYENGLKNS